MPTQDRRVPRRGRCARLDGSLACASCWQRVRPGPRAGVRVGDAPQHVASMSRTARGLGSDAAGLAGRQRKGCRQAGRTCIFAAPKADARAISDAVRRQQFRLTRAPPLHFAQHAPGSCAAFILAGARSTGPAAQHVTKGPCRSTAHLRSLPRGRIRLPETRIRSTRMLSLIHI